MQPKYSHPEIERRWLVEKPDDLRIVGARTRTIEDKYLTGGRLRLRKVSEEGRQPVFKLCMKYEHLASEPGAVVNIYLTETEYKVLAALPGRTAKKFRYSVEGGALDVYQQPDHRLAIFEMEFMSSQAAAAYILPKFLGQEITHHEAYTGFELAVGPSVG